MENSRFGITHINNQSEHLLWVNISSQNKDPWRFVRKDERGLYQEDGLIRAPFSIGPKSTVAIAIGDISADGEDDQPNFYVRLDKDSEIFKGIRIYCSAEPGANTYYKFVVHSADPNNGHFDGELEIDTEGAIRANDSILRNQSENIQQLPNDSSNAEQNNAENRINEVPVDVVTENQEPVNGDQPVHDDQPVNDDQPNLNPESNFQRSFLRRSFESVKKFIYRK